MPPIGVLLSLLALVPFVYLGLGAVGHIPDTAARMLVALIDYAALILAFVGGVHWGLAMVPGSPRPSARLLGGALPLIVAWLALVAAQSISPGVALTLLIAGYLATVLTEHRGAERLLLPRRYVWLRWVVSFVGVAMMTMVLVLRGVGQTIVF